MMSINNIMSGTVFTLVCGICGCAPGYLYSKSWQSRYSVSYGNIFFVKYGFIIAGSVAGGLMGSVLGRLLALRR